MPGYPNAGPPGSLHSGLAGWLTSGQQYRPRTDAGPGLDSPRASGLAYGLALAVRPTGAVESPAWLAKSASVRHFAHLPYSRLKRHFRT
jgi:hypothetical protein